MVRSDLDRTGHATVREAPQDSAFGWFAGRADEIVVPLGGHQPPRAIPRSARCVPGTGSSRASYGARRRRSPTSLLGRFVPDYLRLPEAVLTTVMRKHQRYLPIRDPHGALLPCFIAVANGPIDADAVRFTPDPTDGEVFDFGTHANDFLVRREESLATETFLVRAAEPSRSPYTPTWSRADVRVRLGGRRGDAEPRRGADEAVRLRAR